MKVEDIRARVHELGVLVGRYRPDHEDLHGREDAIHRDVLLAIAEGRCADPAACAREALRTTHLLFDRWCA